MQARTLCAILFFVAGIVLAASANAGEVLRWVDGNGVTHFGDRNAAPDIGARIVDVHETNGMVAPDTAVLDQTVPGSRIALQRAQVQNKRGWRGYEDNLARSKSRGARRTSGY